MNIGTGQRLATTYRQSGKANTDQFISIWDTTNPGTSDSSSIALPLRSGFSYSCSIDWGDGDTTELNTTSPGTLTHTYAEPGQYAVTVSGSFGAMRFSNGGDKNKLLEIANWGGYDPYPQTTANLAFYAAQNLRITATDSPSLPSGSNYYAQFAWCPQIEQLGRWDTTTLCENDPYTGTDTKRMGLAYLLWTAFYVGGVYYGASGSFNQCIDDWNVSNVRSIFAFLAHQIKYNQPINSWNTSNILDMASAFYNCREFNQPLDNWDTSNVVTMNGMFGSTSLPEYETNPRPMQFNQNLGSWDLSNVTDIAFMFSVYGGPDSKYSGSAFNNGGSDSIRNWNTSNVTTMAQLFQGATSFNQPLDGWDTSKVTNFSACFRDATSFDQDLSSWNIASASNMSQMFERATLSTANYDALLVSWASQSVSSSIDFHGGYSKYTGTFGSAPSASRAKLINTYNWTIVDGGPA